ncbi:MAG TPA: TIGR02757 family protein [Bacteroidales bacterium]|nr:TIGR02757 family protein [Bacteroidales bacterium]
MGDSWKKKFSYDEMKDFLELKYEQFNNPSFIEKDPVSVPHKYSLKQDIEISGFLTATIAWGRRDLIINSANNLMNLMGQSPHDYIMNICSSSLDKIEKFYYRTFNGNDCRTFMQGLKNIYTRYDSMEDVIVSRLNNGRSWKEAIISLRDEFFSIPHNNRTLKHFADISRGAAGKRLNMFFRWMVRDDSHGVDFGIWKKIDKSVLYIPLDFHTGNTSRKLELLSRKQDDWKAVEELTSTLREFDADDPVKYDFSLFGLGIIENF